MKSRTRLITALSGKGQEFAGEVSRITDQAVKSIEAKSFVFTQTMMDNSEEIARLINDSSQNATSAMTRTLGQLQQGTQSVTDAAKQAITRSLEDLQAATRASIEELKQTAAATVADMLETNSMLRSDTTALFERLREANILLQEVLSGAHENMASLERTMVTRVSEFITAMNDLSTKSDTSASMVERHVGTFNTMTGKTLRELGEISAQFNVQGRSLAEAVDLLDRSNRRTEESIANRHTNLEALVTTLDSRSEDFAQRLQRFAALLDESLDAATSRARQIAGIIAETSNDSVRTIEQQFELVRTTTEEERKRTSENMNTVYDEAATQAHTMFAQSADRFTEIMLGMKQMAAEMQRELETTRAELRRGIFELPQETADSAAQMRRVIVDQIEALAELNRIVARHGRSLDTAEPVRREPEPVHAGGGRNPPRPPRGDITTAPPPPARGDITGAPAAPRRTAVAERRRAQWRLAQRSADPRVARRSAYRSLRPRSRSARSQSARSAEIRARIACGRRCPHDRSRRCRRIVGALQARRTRPVQQAAVHAARPEGIRRNPPQIPRRSGIPPDGRAIYSRVRTPAGGRVARRPRRGGGAQLPDLRYRQGLHLAGARGRSARLISRPAIIGNDGLACLATAALPFAAWKPRFPCLPPPMSKRPLAGLPAWRCTLRY